AHLATSMLFLSLMVGIAFNTFQPRFEAAPVSLLKLKRWVLPTLVLIYFQIVLGALVRHTGAGLACMDIPFCRGSLWPEGAPPILQVHMLHRLGGIVVALMVFLSSWRVAQVGRENPCLRRLALLAPILVLIQVSLGLWSIYSALGLFPVTAHLGVGALLLVTYLLMNLVVRASRAATISETPATIRGNLRPTAI
ncbi:MAG: COX15/CtaA family protein, partial [Deltaproteobacteria bacterium]|nr:COX15/CtaA family protein [Deltaproteobacteria bacterium]